MTKIYAAWLFAGRIKNGTFYYQKTRTFILAEDNNEARDKAVDKLTERLIILEGDFVDVEVELVPESWYTLKDGIEEVVGNVSNPSNDEEFPDASLRVM